MKIFHTADWHLGKLVQGVSMIEDQKIILNQWIEQIKEENPDLIIIAGDIYDRAIPPPEAVQLLNDILARIVNELHIPVIAIAGNHDSPSRLDFGSQLMKAQGFHIVGSMQEEIEKVTIHDAYGPVNFYLVPFADPSVVRNIFADDSIRTYDQAMETIVSTIQETMNKQERNILIGHAFVTPYGEAEENTSDSEKPLSIGGAEYVNARHFASFDYTALGHLHQAHQVGTERIQYAGSILKYSLSEQHHKKGYLQVELTEKGNLTIEKIQLTPIRDLRTVRGTMEEILAKEKSDDYVFVEIVNEELIIHPMEKVRSVFPNAMQVKQLNDPITRKILAKEKERKTRDLTDDELFRSFYQHINETEAPEKIERLFTQMMNKQVQKERETIGGDL